MPPFGKRAYRERCESTMSCDVTGETKQQKKKKMKLQNSEVTPEMTEEPWDSEFHQLEAREVEISTENQASTLGKEGKNSELESLPRPIFQTTNEQDRNLCVPQQGISEEGLKKRKKNRWPNALKKAMKQKRLEAMKAAVNCVEQKETPGKGRNNTMNIEFPGSVMENTHCTHMKNFLAGLDAGETQQQKKKKNRWPLLRAEKKARKRKQLEEMKAAGNCVEEQEETPGEVRNDTVNRVGPGSVRDVAQSLDTKIFSAGTGISWEEWQKKRREEYRMLKEAEDSSKQRHLMKSNTAVNCVEEQKEVPGKVTNYIPKIVLPGSATDIAQSPNVTIFPAGSDIGGTRHQKKKEVKHRNSEVAPEKTEETQASEAKQLDAREMEISAENQASSLDTEDKKSIMKSVPRSMLQTASIRDMKLFLAEQGMSYKEWKRKSKEEYRMWQEARKLKRLAESKTAVNCVEEKETPGKGRSYTVSIALPGSVMDNAQSPEMKVFLAGLVARFATIFQVNEIVIFEESPVPSRILEGEDAPLKLWRKQGSAQLIKILQYLECPQYLRRFFFPLQKDLAHAGLLHPLNIPHHLKVDDVSPYREGVTLNKPVRDGKGSFVYIGFQKSAVIDKALEPDVRVTVKLDEKQQTKKHFTGIAVSPSTPYKEDGIYWGYSVRFAESLGTVFSKCPFKEGYDVTIGTSDKGSNVDYCALPSFKHLLIVFGGLNGLEACLEADETLANIDDPSCLFNHYLNTCPDQGTRTIRTEEAIPITLAALRPKILQCQASK